MTPAVSTSFIDADFGDFLYAPIGCESNGMTLSVLSALARLNVDPWREAAKLSALPKDTAAKRLAILLPQLTAGGLAPKDCEPTAERLIQLLPCRSNPTISPRERRRNAQQKARWTLPVLIAAALAVAALVAIANRSPSSDGDRDAPVFAPAPPQSQ